MPKADEHVAGALSRRTVMKAGLATGALAGVSQAGVAASPDRSAPLAQLGPRVLPAQRSWPAPLPQVPVTEGLAQLSDVKLWYWDTGGDGEPVVLLHPFTGSAAIWRYQQPVFAAAGYRVIAYSRRGHYRSETGPQDQRGHGAVDLDHLMDVLEIDKFHLVGTAGGGFMVPDYALLRPDRLLSLTIACSQGGVADPDYRALIDVLTPEGFSDMPASFRELGPAYRTGNRAGMAQWEALEHIARAETGWVWQPPRAPILWRDIASIETPALIFTGAADLYMPPPVMIELARHFRDAETAILSESGHSGYWEQPDAFNALVLDFIRRHPA